MNSKVIELDNFVNQHRMMHDSLGQTLQQHTVLWKNLLRLLTETSTISPWLRCQQRLFEILAGLR